MKKTIGLLFVIYITVFNSTAQIDQLTALKNIPEKTEFVECSIDWASDGKMIVYPKSMPKILSYKNNDIGETASFYLNQNYIANKEAEPAQPRPNHPMKPSLFYSTFTGVGKVIMGSMIYEFKRNKLENILDGNFKIAAIYEVKSEDKKELKMQLKGKSTNLTTIDHNKVLKEYFSEMKKVQENASANMSDSDIEKAAEAKRIQEEKERARMGQVSADFNKGKEASPVKVAFKNNSTQNICIVEVKSNGDVFTHSVHSNDQDAWSCSSSYYYALDKNGHCGSSQSRGELIVGEGAGCNQTIVIK